MNNLDAVIVTLKQERDRLNHAISALEGVGTNGASRSNGTRNISAAGRARIAAAQRKRWAAVRAKQKKH
jgi:hypothetical protein